MRWPVGMLLLALLLVPFNATGQELILDNSSSFFHIQSGDWTLFPPLNNCVPCYGQNLVYTSHGTGSAKARWVPRIPRQGTYDVYIWWFADSDRSSMVPLTISHAEGAEVVLLDQTTQGSQWNYLGTYPFIAGPSGYIEISNATDSGNVVADAVRLEFKEIFTGTVCPDADSDGYQNKICGGLDCNDEDPFIHPGAEEMCGNGIDEDCVPSNDVCNLCGNGVENPGEDCITCPEDLDCGEDYMLGFIETPVQEGALFTISVTTQDGTPLSGVLALYGTQSAVSNAEGKVTLRAFRNTAPVVTLTREGYLQNSVTVRFPEVPDAQSLSIPELVYGVISNIGVGDALSFTTGDYFMLFLMLAAVLILGMTLLIFLLKKTRSIQKKPPLARAGVPPILDPSLSASLKHPPKGGTRARVQSKPVSSLYTQVLNAVSRVKKSFSPAVKRTPTPPAPPSSPGSGNPSRSLAEIIRHKAAEQEARKKKPIQKTKMPVFSVPKRTPPKPPASLKPTPPAGKAALNQMIRHLEQKVRAAPEKESSVSLPPAAAPPAAAQGPGTTPRETKPSTPGVPGKTTQKADDAPPASKKSMSAEALRKKRIEELKKRMKETLGEMKLGEDE